MIKTRVLIKAISLSFLSHPSLYFTGFKLYKSTISRQGNILIRFLPSKRYIDFRMHTQYGDENPSIEVVKKDFIEYLTWVKNYSKP